MIGATEIPEVGFYAGIALILGACFKFALDLYRHVQGGRDRLTLDDARELVRTEAPYVKDRKLIAETLRQNQEQIRQLTENVTKLLVSESALSTQLANLESKIEDIHAATTKSR